MKLTTDKKTGRIYAHLKTGKPSEPYLRISLKTTSKKEARAKAKAAKLPEVERLAQADALTRTAFLRLTTSGKITTNEAAEQWFAGAEARGDSAATAARDKITIRQWLSDPPSTGKLHPSEHTLESLQAWVNKPGKAKKQTRVRNLSNLRKFFTYLVSIGAAPSNIAAAVKVNHRALTHEQREPRIVKPLTDAELAKLIGQSEGWHRWAAGIAAAAGMRLGDIAQLEHASLSVPGHIIVWTDKRDRRVCLPINKTVTPGLANMLAEIPPSDGRYVFPEAAALYEDVEKGRPLLSIRFKRVLEGLGIEGKSFHSLRHTAITRWRKQGFSLDECREYAGHTSTKTTSGYDHSEPKR